jgi:hypothetical protein
MNSPRMSDGIPAEQSSTEQLGSFEYREVGSLDDLIRLLGPEFVEQLVGAAFLIAPLDELDLFSLGADRTWAYHQPSNSRK